MWVRAGVEEQMCEREEVTLGGVAGARLMSAGPRDTGVITLPIQSCIRGFS